MVDKISKTKRSENMSRIRSANTEIEVTVRKWLFSKGIRYRKNVKNLPGQPDIVIGKSKIIIFVNGCFWHGHSNCQISHLPKSSEEYWNSKILKTKNRDEENIKKLKLIGWEVIIIWECELKKDERKALVSLLELIKNQENFIN